MPPEVAAAQFPGLTAEQGQIVQKQWGKRLGFFAESDTDLQFKTHINYELPVFDSALSVKHYYKQMQSSQHVEVKQSYCSNA